MFKITASQISDNIDIDSFKGIYKAELFYSDKFELFYKVDAEICFSVYSYGVVCFFNCDNLKSGEIMKALSDHCVFFYDSEFNKEYNINPKATELKFSYNNAELTYFDFDVLRIIMLNISQSVTLDYYFQKSRILLNDTNKYTSNLEKTGKLTISDKKLKKIVGLTNSIKNEIVENLRILELIQETTDNIYIIVIDLKLKKALFINEKYHCVQKEIEYINENLEYFSALMEHGDFMKSEWIWAVLLAIFAIDIVFRDFLHELFIFIQK